MNAVHRQRDPIQLAQVCILAKKSGSHFQVDKRAEGEGKI